MIPSVTRSATFRSLSQHGQRAQHGPIRLTFVGSATIDEVPSGERALAFALSRRFGNAVERNRARRRLRAAFEHVVDAAPSGAFLISAQRGVLTTAFPQLVQSFLRCFERLEAGPGDRSGITP